MRAVFIVVVLGAFVGEAAAGPSCPGQRPARTASGFARARASFCAHAAKALKRSVERISVAPIDDEPDGQPPQRVGAAWAFYGYESRAREVRGWAMADGTVITPEMNLGHLLDEAGVWSARPTLDASGLAERIVWALGMNHRVVGPRSLRLDPSGVGALRFRVAYRPPGPSHAPDRVSECTVTLTEDHRAQLRVVEVPPPSTPQPE